MSDFVLSDMNHSSLINIFFCIYFPCIQFIRSHFTVKCDQYYIWKLGLPLSNYQVISLSLGDDKYIVPLYWLDDCC